MGDVISYSYLVPNTGNVSLAGPVTVTDDKTTVTCPAGGLAPVALDHLHRQLHHHPGRPRRRLGDQHRQPRPTARPRTRTTATVTAAEPGPEPRQVPDPGDLRAVGDVISYSYLVTNTGN